MLLLSLYQGHIPDDSGKPPHVLVFQITAVTEFIDDHCQHIVPVPQGLCHIKLSCVAGTLAVSYEDAVKPYMVSTLHAVKPQDIFPVLLFLLPERMAVNSGGVIRLYARIIQDRKKRHCVIVMRRTITIKLPVPGNRHGAKLSVIISFLHARVRNIKR